MFELNDRAANYGDGVFTTMLIQHDGIALLDRHISRLHADARRLCLNLTDVNLREVIFEQAIKSDNNVLKLLISSGSGGRGYFRSLDTCPRLYFSTHAFPDIYTQWRESGIVLGTTTVQLAKQPLLAGCKHLNRLEQVLVKQSFSTSSVDDVLVCDTDNRVVEASAANLFWLKGKRWYTPSLSSSGVAGVMRSFLIDWFAKQKCAVEVCHSTLPDLFNVDAMIMCNAIMGIVPVRRIVLKAHTFDVDIAPVLELQRAIQPALEGENASFI